MRDSRSSRRMGRKLRLAAAIVGAAIALPSLATADPISTCSGTSCPIFRPDIVAMGGDAPFTDTPSSVVFHWAASDRTMPVVDATLTVPKGWQFAVNSVRTAQVSDGASGTVGNAAANCDQVFSGDKSDGASFATDDVPATLNRAEVLSGLPGVIGYTKFLRDSTDDTPVFGSGAPGTLTFGTTWQNRSKTNSNPRNQFPTVSFLGWNSTTRVASLCMYLYANDVNVALDDGTEFRPAREHIVPVTMTEMNTTPVTDPAYVPGPWKIHYDLSSFFSGNDAGCTNGLTGCGSYFKQQDLSILDGLFAINATSGANWNVNGSGQREGVTFSRAPHAPGSYTFSADLATCKQSFDPTTSSGCAAGDLFHLVQSKTINVTPPPSNVKHEFGKLTGPAGGGAPLAGTGWGVLRGTSKATIQWTQPGTNPGAIVKGYEVSVAVPGDNDFKHTEYLVTKDGEPGFDARQPCGPTGTAGTCALELDLASNLATPKGPLPKEGKLDVSLVTIYTDGTRTDYLRESKCDNGLAGGAPCSPSVAPPQVSSPGFSVWSFYITPKDFPVGFAEVASYTVTGGGGSKSAPFFVLLVNFATHQAQYVVTNPTGGKANVYRATSNQIVGDNDAGTGVISFGSGTVAGWTQNFRFDGSAPGALRDDVDGLFTLYDAKGAPAFSEMPTADVHQFVGSLLE